ncbi:MAG: lipoate--protein ligase [Chromatiales bacterium 21-64-14]|nr:MAG: lipoate--protein ligase [Chromatiales bacterium 21-64-14]HQU16034.1 lipoate--protein ligase family protein [Gammaproteobacteria bacterium]
MNARSAAVWRVIDTGLRSPAENISLNRALLESHQARHSPHTLRFLRFTPAALVGFHQSVRQELREDYCRQNGIAVQRRITGGGAIYFDETQIGWELYLDKRAVGSADMQSIAGRICEAAARGISRLGVDARFRPRNDIEVGGRKVSGTGGAFDGDSLLYQGTLLIDFDVERMLRVLRIPAEKLSDKAVRSARERVANLKELLGNAPPLDEVQRCMVDAFAEEFGISFEPAAELSACEQEKYLEALAEIDTPEWVYQHDRPVSELPIREGIYRCRGGLLRASVRIDVGRGRIKEVWLTGDFFVSPRRMVPDLEAALRDIPVAQLPERVSAFFARHPVEMLSLDPEDFTAVITSALDTEPVAETTPAG